MQKTQQEAEQFYDSQEEYFVDCCRAGDLEEVQEALKDQSLDLTWLSQDLNNCLHMAAANGHLPVVQAIFTHLTNNPKVRQTLLNNQNADGNTPLHYAAICGHKDVVEAFVTAGADPNLTNECKRTPFKEAELLNKMQIAEILAKVTKFDPAEIREEDLIQPEAANQRVEEEEETEENEEKQQKEQKEQKQQKEEKELQKVAGKKQQFKKELEKK